jgi:hypothetical protein
VVTKVRSVVKRVKRRTNWSGSNLSRRRYAQNDETLYVAPEDERTDYVGPMIFRLPRDTTDVLDSHSLRWQIGMTGFSSRCDMESIISAWLTRFYFSSTGKRRYGHPALNGVLPEPWLPLKKGQTLANHDRSGGTRASKDSNQAVVLTLRKRYSVVRKSTRLAASSGRGPVDHLTSGMGEGLNEVQRDGTETSDSAVSNPWQDARPGRSQITPAQLSHRLSFDHGSGVIVLPEDAEWLTPDPDSDSEDDYRSTSGLENSQPDLSSLSEVVLSTSAGISPVSPSKRRYGTYYHHPERRQVSCLAIQLTLIL